MDCVHEKGPLGKPGVYFETESESCNTIEAGFSISKLNQRCSPTTVVDQQDGGKSSN